MNKHPIKFEFVEAENLLDVGEQQLVVVDDRFSDAGDFIVDLVQRIFPEIKFPAKNWSALADYLCELDTGNKPNIVIAHSALPQFSDPQQIESYICTLADVLQAWRIKAQRPQRLVVRFLRKDERYVVNMMDADWRQVSASPHFDPKRYGI